MRYTLQEQIKDINKLISKAKSKKNYPAVARLNIKKEEVEKKLNFYKKSKRQLVKGVGFNGRKKPKVSASSGLKAVRRLF